MPLRNNLKLFYDPVEMSGGYQFNHTKTLRMIDNYYNSRYLTGEYDGSYRKSFYNICKSPCDVASKFVDIDRKDIQLIPTKRGDDLKAFLMKKDLQHWMKENDFGKLLNDITTDYPKYGSVVIKKGRGGNWEKVSIQNLRMNPAVNKLEDSEFVYEVHNLSREEIEEMNWNGNTEELFKRLPEEKSYLIYACYEKENTGWKRYMYGDVYAYKDKNGATVRGIEALVNDRSEEVPPIILDERNAKELPYRELHWEKIPGRWLGFGFVEYLEEEQVATNEAENLERKGLFFTALHLYQSRDESLRGQNVVRDAENGDVVISEQAIEDFPNEERNLAAFNTTRGRWTEGIQRKTFTFPAATGEELKSRTPFGVADLQASTIESYFGFKRENYGLFIEKLILEDILLSFKNKKSTEHILTFLGDDEELDKLDEAVTRILVDDQVVKVARKDGFFPSKAAREKVEKRVRANLKKGDNRYLKIPTGFYNNINTTISVTTTGEQFDTGRRAQIIQIALQILNSNPAILQNPGTKSLFFELLNMGDVSPVAFSIEGQPLPQGGSVSVPNAQPGAIQGNQQL